VLPDSIDELTPVKSYREDNFGKLPPPRQAADEFFRYVVSESAIRAEAVNDYAHGYDANSLAHSVMAAA
jgi:hypothetical protein